jgi:hypothetical protein
MLNISFSNKTRYLKNICDIFLDIKKLKKNNDNFNGH